MMGSRAAGLLGCWAAGLLGCWAEAAPIDDSPILVADDGLSYRLLGPDEPFSRVQQIGSSVWEYVGQATFPILLPGEDDRKFGSHATGVRPSPVGDIGVDADGRMWMLVSTEVEPGPEDAGSTIHDVSSLDLVSPDVRPELLSWSTSAACAHRIFDDESRVKIDHQFVNNLLDRYPLRSHRAVVSVQVGYLVWTNWPIHPPQFDTAVRRCTGVKLGRDFVLTAGHCLATEGSGGIWTESNPAVIQVCDQGKIGPLSECVQATFVNVNDAFLSTGSTDQDWGVIHLAEAVGGVSDFMSMSTRSEATWDAFALYNLAHPGAKIGFSGGAPTCAVNGSLGSGYHPSFQYGSHTFELWSADLFHQSLPWNHANVTSTQLRYKGDNSGGSSGSPLFICPTKGNCNLALEVLALNTAYMSGVSYRFRGPKVSQFRTWVNANAP